MDVRIVKHGSYEKTPSYANEGDAGIDLKSVAIISDDDNQIIYGAGISLEIPKNHVGMIFPRSSIRKKKLIMANSVGIIDSGYRGEVQVTFNKKKGYISLSDGYAIGDRICQIIILPIPVINFIPVKRLSDSVRGTAGHGSTGK